MILPKNKIKEIIKELNKQKEIRTQELINLNSEKYPHITLFTLEVVKKQEQIRAYQMLIMTLNEFLET